MQGLEKKSVCRSGWLRQKVAGILMAGALLSGYGLSGPGTSEATPLYGPAPSNAAGGQPVPGGDFTPPPVPDQAVPSANGPGFNGPNSPGGPGNGSSPSLSPGGGTPGQGPGGAGSAGGGAPGTANGSQPPASTAPTFMSGALPNTSNPFLPNNISPGLISGPLENAYLLNGVPQMAAPLMSAVYRPFGLTYFQPNPFQVTPQGSVSLTGAFGEETNVNFSPTQPEAGGYYMIMPAVMYSTFDDYGYLSLLANASYYGFTTGNISPYLEEVGGLSAGSYLGTRVFVGAQDFVFNGSTPMMNGQPMQFLNGINGSYGNMADAEVGVALTPKVTFVESASDMYYGNEGYGAGFMNLQAVTSALNYMDKVNYLNASYIYQQGLFSDFPSFYANGASGTAMHQINPTTSLGVGGTVFYYFYQGLPGFDTTMYSYYGMFTRSLTRRLFLSAMGGWNAVVFENGQNFQAPEWDVNLGYSDNRFGVGVNVGEFMENANSFGIELGPEKVKEAMGYLSYVISPKTTAFGSVGYTEYDFLAAAPFSNSFFQTLSPTISYSGTFIEGTAGVSYLPYTWMTTTLMYNIIDGTTNIPNETIVDNIVMAMVTFTWNFK